jgi:hypothetical protein
MDLDTIPVGNLALLSPRRRSVLGPGLVESHSPLFNDSLLIHNSRTIDVKRVFYYYAIEEG